MIILPGCQKLHYRTYQNNVETISFIQTTPKEQLDLYVTRMVPEIRAIISSEIDRAIKEFKIQLEEENKNREKEKAAIDAYYTRKEVAQRCRCSLTTVNNWSNDGKLTRIQAGRRILFRKEEVDAMLKPVDG